MKKLYRSEDNKVIFGILGGVGEYYDVDPAMIRLGYVILMFITGVFPLAVAYFIAALIVPKKPNKKTNEK